MSKSELKLPEEYDYLFNLNELVGELRYSNAGMSQVHVAVCLIAYEPALERYGAFYAANIEIARKYVYHAEEVALLKAINQGYTKPVHVIITSYDEKYLHPMCPGCAGIYNYVDPECKITVMDTSGKWKFNTTVKGTQTFPYKSKGFIV